MNNKTFKNFVAIQPSYYPFPSKINHPSRVFFSDEPKFGMPKNNSEEKNNPMNYLNGKTSPIQTSFLKKNIYPKASLEFLNYIKNSKGNSIATSIPISNYSFYNNNYIFKLNDTLYNILIKFEKILDDYINNVWPSIEYNFNESLLRYEVKSKDQDISILISINKDVNNTSDIPNSHIISFPRILFRYEGLKLKKQINFYNKIYKILYYENFINEKYDFPIQNKNPFQ
jgi:hypothetical protein